MTTHPTTGGTSMDATQFKQLMARAALVKMLEDTVKREAVRVKAELGLYLDPGDRKSATLGAGLDVGTVSFSKRTTKTVLDVTDEAALIDWLKTSRDGEGVVETVADWVTAGLNAEFQKTGEIPPGMEPVEKTSGGSISFRQTDEQRDTLLQAMPAARRVAGLIDAPVTEAP